MTSASVVKHFKLEGFSRSTFYDILKRKQKNIGDESYFRLCNTDLSGNAGYYTSANT